MCVSMQLSVIVCIVDIAIVTVRAVTIVAHAHNSINRKVSKDSEFPRVCIFVTHFRFLDRAFTFREIRHVVPN